MPQRICFDLANPTQWPIKLIQTGRDRFVVIYGLQRFEGLDYAEAAAKLGQSIMHAQACEGLLDPN